MATKPKPLPPVDPPAAVEGPTIEFIGEGAKDVKFTVNPRAARIIVRNDGIIVEHLK